jgi:hypothetical protein
MVRPKFIVTKEHKATFNYALTAKSGDTVKVGKEDEEMPGWYWCKDKVGVEAWIPKTYLEIHEDHGIFLQDYNSVELDAQPGEEVQYLDETLGWAECLNSEWKYGWLPLHKIEKI